MHTAHLTIEPTGPSRKQADYEFHTPCLFRAIGQQDHDQEILLVSKAPVPGNCKLVDVIGMLRFGPTVDTVELHSEVVTPVLVTPDWGPQHPWSKKDGLVQRHAYVTCMNDRLGGADSFRFNQTADGKPVGNCSLASRDHLAILGGHMDSKPAWFKITFWGAAANTAQALQPGQAIQLLSGVLSFQHWGDEGNMLSVGISARTILKGATPSGIPGRDGEAPPVDAEATEQAAPPVVADEVPPAAMDYSDIPM
jgi:single-stranded DNA-binding protein